MACYGMARYLELVVAYHEEFTGLLRPSAEEKGQRIANDLDKVLTNEIVRNDYIELSHVKVPKTNMEKVVNIFMMLIHNHKAEWEFTQ